MTDRPAMLPVLDARRRILASLSPLPAETVPFGDVSGRVLAEPVHATRTQPPADFSAMDGYAVQSKDLPNSPEHLAIAGESKAGQGFEGRVPPGSAIRIFTGAPVPIGLDTVVIQENTKLHPDNHVEICGPVTVGQNIRKAGMDFNQGDALLEQGTTVGPRQLALIAAANVCKVCVYRRPRIALLSTGDELVNVGEVPGKDAIIDSITPALACFIDQNGGVAQILPQARDTLSAIKETISSLAPCDMLVTIGGASVGDYDLVRSGLGESGMTLDFWKIAMRPGKPLMFGTLGETPVLGLPGNPVSALVTAYLFLGPAIDRLTGRPPREPALIEASLTKPLSSNGPREAWLSTNATFTGGRWQATPHPIQDSSVLSSLAAANAFLVRPPYAPAIESGVPVHIHLLDRSLIF